MTYLKSHSKLAQMDSFVSLAESKSNFLKQAPLFNVWIQSSWRSPIVLLCFLMVSQEVMLISFVILWSSHDDNHLGLCRTQQSFYLLSFLTSIL